MKSNLGLTESDIKGKKVLDVGCGTGRLIEICLKWGAKEVVGVDMIDPTFAKRHFKDNKNVRIYQADLNHLPFKEKFDVIFSLGVLHHTPDTKKSFENLLPYLDGGGIISIWLYEKRAIRYLFSEMWRKLTTRLPEETVYKIALATDPILYPIYRIPLLGIFLRWVFPKNMNKVKDQRIWGFLDWYTPKYQWKHSRDEVRGWFQENNLKVVWIADKIPVGVKGIKEI